MRKTIALALLTSVLAACSSSTKSGPAGVKAGPADYKGFVSVAMHEPQPGLAIYHYRHTKSGLDVLVSPKPGSGVVAYVTAYEVGSRWEVNGRTGLAHLFEHMMFRGTDSYPNPFETLADWGGRFNAYTSPDVTVYFELVPKKLFADAAKFEAERMRKLKITPEGFDTERGAVVSERKMRTEDSPSGRLYWELFQLAYDKHPYETGPIGWQEDLDATTFDDARAFYDRFYAPNRAILSLVGDFSLKEALAMVDRYYGDFESAPFEEPNVAAEPVRKGTRRKVIPMKVESVYLADAVFGPTYHDASVAVDSLIANLLADDKLGYLAGQLVETGIARSVGGDADPSMDPSLSTVVVIGNPGISRARLEAAYDAARERFPSWLTAQKLESFKLYYLASQWASLRDPLHLAMQTASSAATTGDPVYDLAFLAKIQAVTLADVRKRWPYWTSSARTRVILEPSKANTPLANKQKGASR